MKVPKFTPAEQRVVRLITLGLSTKEVARVLGKAVSTVDNQRTSAMRAAEINTATLLVRVALKAGITTLDDDLTPAERRRLRLATHRGKRKGTRRGAAQPSLDEDASLPTANEERPRKSGKKSPPSAAKAARRGKKTAAAGASGKKGASGKPSKKKRAKRRAAPA